MYKEKDFNGCVFNPLCNGSLLDVYPRLSEIVPEALWADQQLDNILRFLIVMYDPNSPLIRNEKDLKYRRAKAFELCGIHDEGLQTALETHTHYYFPKLVFEYLKRFGKSKEWAVIAALEYCFWESIYKLISPISGDNSKIELDAVQKKEVIKDGVDKDIKRLEQYYKQFFGGDEVLEKKVKKRISPELIASNGKS